MSNMRFVTGVSPVASSRVDAMCTRVGEYAEMLKMLHEMMEL